MTTSIHIRWGLMFQAFWGARAEDAAAVAARLALTLDALDGFREALDARWVDDRASDISTDHDSLARLVSRGVPASIDGTELPEQGFSVVLLLVPRSESPFQAPDSLRVEVSAGSGLSPRRVFFNSVIVEGSSRFPEHETYPLWADAFGGLVAAWGPDHAALLTKEQRRLNESRLPDEPDVPWIGAMSYLGEATGGFPESVAAARVESTDEGSLLLLLPDEPLDALDGDAAGRVVDDLLGQGWNARIPRVQGAATRTEHEAPREATTAARPHRRRQDHTMTDIADQHHLVAVAERYFAELAPDAELAIVPLDGDAGVCVVRTARGGGKIYVAPDESALFVGSSLDFDAGLAAFLSGTRTPPEKFRRLS